MNASPLLLVLDEGTTSTRAIAFDLSGAIVAQAGAPLTQFFPQPGWVEHDAAQIWAESLRALGAVAAQVGPARIAAIGITNQRETIIFWDRRTGEPIAPAIVWQDRRSADICEALRGEGLEPQVQSVTGLLLDPYFSATKIMWALANWPQVRAAADAGTLAIGTVDCYLRFRLTGGTVFATDATNASRMLLMDLATCQWDEALIARYGIPRAALPDISDCAGALGTTTLLGGEIPITGSVGDQQAAAIGQACLTAGMVKATYGTGTFVLAHAGAVPPKSAHRLLATVAWRLGGVAAYAIEGSIFTAGSAVQWLRDGLQIVATAADTEALARSVPDSGGVVVVPAFAGLGAPYWRPDARGLMTGLTAGTTRAHIVRATLEAMGDQTADLIEALAKDGVSAATLRVDGGMVANNWLCQDLANALGITVERPRIIETTALGAAMCAGLGAGLFASLAATAAMAQPDRVFAPDTDSIARTARRDRWAQAVRQVLAS
jgi:glycerol kinase